MASCFPGAHLSTERMRKKESPISVSRVLRIVFGAATIFSGLSGLVFREDTRWFVAAGVFGILWLSWDLLVEHVLEPFGEWAAHIFVSGAGDGPPPNIRPSLDDTIRLLESHLDHRASRQVEINAAIRLEEIYRTVKKDPERAREVIERVRERYPDATELPPYDDDDVESG